MNPTLKVNIPVGRGCDLKVNGDRLAIQRFDFAMNMDTGVSQFDVLLYAPCAATPKTIHAQLTNTGTWLEMNRVGCPSSCGPVPNHFHLTLADPAQTSKL